MDTKALRQKILDLAIHGKLVPQDPNDEPASVLLQRIRAEKEKLIKEGKIKKGKKSAKTSDTPHYPYELPKGWEWTTLGDLFTLQAGKSITAKDIFPKQSEIHKYPCFGGNGIRGFVTNCNRHGEYPIIGRQGALCGNVNLATGNFYATEHAVVVERYSNTDLMWTYYTLVALNLNQYATATAQPGLSVNVINDVHVPLPPLQEQDRISVAIIHIFSMIDIIENGKSDLKTAVKQAKSKILDLAIHGKLVSQDPNDEPASELLKRINPKAEIASDNAQYGKLPKGWCKCKFKDIFLDISSKPYQILQSQIKADGQYPVVSQSSNFIEGFSEQNNFYKADTPIVVFGDHTRNVKYIDFNFIVGADGVKIIKPLHNGKYGYYLIMYASLHIQNKGYSRHYSQITNFIYLLPPLAEQQRIVAKIEQLFAQLDHIEAEL